MTNEERLAKIEQGVARIEERQTAQMERINEILVAHEDRVMCLEKVIDGDQSSPGLKTDVALLKSWSERLRWLIRTTIGAVIVALVTGIVALMRKLS